MTRAKQPKRFNEIAGDLYQAFGLQKAYRQHRALQVWGSVVGDGVASVTRIERFTEGTLFVKVRSSTWRMELSYRKEEIASRLNEALGEELVMDIVFR